MKIALGVSGGIAAYKAAEITRLLQDKGVRVQVIMTEAAGEFVRPLTFAALTGEKVITGLWGAGNEQPNVESAVEHIAVAQGIDALLVAPATADVIAKFANGIANDFLTTTYLATTAPVIVAPAMNVNMWEHPATQANLAKLRDRGVRIVEPGSGYLACGMIGAGRLAENEFIVNAVMEALGPQDLAGETVLVTAGPTREAVDPVRYVGNRSSGKMGYALAEAAARRGARVVLISGPTSLTPPAGVETVNVQTAEQMLDAVLNRFREATVIIKAAAVADFRVKNSADLKIKRKGPITLELEPTVDILAQLGKLRSPSQVLIGFAAETNDVLANARKKLETKGADAIVLNDVSQPGIGFDSERNAVRILTRDEVVDVPETSKLEVAHRVLDTAVKIKTAVRR